MFYIAFDQALACSGVAIYKDGFILASQIKTNTKEPIGFRLSHLEAYWINIFDLLDPEKVFYEYVYANSTTPFESIKVLGLLEKTIAQRNIASLCLRSSSREKKSGNSWRGLLGLGSNKKELQAKLKLEGKANHNICDAIGILGAGLLYNKVIAFPDDLYKIPVNISYERDPQSLCKFFEDLRKMPRTVSSTIR